MALLGHRIYPLLRYSSLYTVCTKEVGGGSSLRVGGGGGGGGGEEEGEGTGEGKEGNLKLPERV